MSNPKNPCFLDFGIVIIDKPEGPSSHKIAEEVKNILGIKKSGHLGTLDTNVSGVLPILLGKATSIASFLMKHDKEYSGVIRFSEAIEKKDVEGLFRKFTGDIWQIPPIGAAVARKKRKRKIYSLHLLKIKGNDISFDVKCEAGTYIRTLAEDIGNASGNDAKLIKLRRIQVGEFNEKDSITLHELSLAYGAWKKEGDSKRLTSIIHPIEDALTGFKKIWVSNGAAEAVCNGAQLMAPGIAKSGSGINIGDTVAIMSLDNAIVAFAEAQMSSNEMQNMNRGIAARIKRVLMLRPQK